MMNTAEEVICLTHEETNQRTKQMLSESLKRFMVRKPLNKITVSDLVTDCNVNRKTFYYHFEDIFALLKWTLDQEATQVLSRFDLMTDMDEVIAFLQDYVRKNAYMLKCAMDATGWGNHMQRFYYDDMKGIVLAYIREIEKEEDVVLDKDYETFLCDFYCEAAAGMMIDQIRNQIYLDDQTTTKYSTLTIRASLAGIMKEVKQRNSLKQEK